MTDSSIDKLREALDALHRVTVRFANGYPLITRATLTEARAAVEALFAALYKSQQAALSANARAAIALEIAGSMLDDPTYERAPPDGDYEHPIHDKIAALTRERDEALTNIKVAELGERNAREALAQARRVPDGWRLVPVEGTDVQLQRMYVAQSGPYGGQMARMYEAAINSAPQPPA